MHRIFEDLVTGFDFKKDLIKDTYNFLIFHNKEEIAEHSRKVAFEAEKLADKLGFDKSKALMAGFLHDISNVIPYENMVNVANEVGIDVLSEEKILPPLLHQRLSKVMATKIFGINDAEILKAIECHTTLRGNPSKLDMILFIADKIQWDKEHSAPFISGVLKGLERTLEESAFAYVKYLYDNKNKMKVLHPWVRDAYNYLEANHP